MAQPHLDAHNAAWSAGLGAWTVQLLTRPIIDETATHHDVLPRVAACFDNCAWMPISPTHAEEGEPRRDRDTVGFGVTPCRVGELRSDHFLYQMPTAPPAVFGLRAKDG
jgi:hypothetical protein